MIHHSLGDEPHELDVGLEATSLTAERQEWLASSPPASARFLGMYDPASDIVYSHSDVISIIEPRFRPAIWILFEGRHIGYYTAIRRYREYVTSAEEPFNLSRLHG